ncbi:MAG: hypothetical protein MH252_07570 [Thermosynechococcaceae cyanobacterium MS004]|nr:hypothetical protein [Thermosynechococcaceae cyanobacterium MS004]
MKDLKLSKQINGEDVSISDLKKMLELRWSEEETEKCTEELKNNNLPYNLKDRSFRVPITALGFPVWEYQNCFIQGNSYLTLKDESGTISAGGGLPSCPPSGVSAIAGPGAIHAGANSGCFLVGLGGGRYPATPPRERVIINRQILPGGASIRVKDWLIGQGGGGYVYAAFNDKFNGPGDNDGKFQQYLEWIEISQWAKEILEHLEK